MLIMPAMLLLLSVLLLSWSSSVSAGVGFQNAQFLFCKTTTGHAFNRAWGAMTKEQCYQTAVDNDHAVFYMQTLPGPVTLCFSDFGLDRLQPLTLITPVQPIACTG